MKILIVDDEEAIRESIAKNLKRNGFTVVTEGFGGQALAAVKREQPDIVLLDLILTDVDGLTVLKEIKTFRNDVIVIVITATKDAVIEGKALACGADDYLNKPFTTTELRAAIHQKTGSIQINHGKIPPP